MDPADDVAYTIHCAYGNVPEGSLAVAELLSHGSDREPESGWRQNYTVTDFPAVFSDPLTVKPYFLSPDGMIAVLRETTNRSTSTVRYAILRKDGTHWITRGIIRGPSSDPSALAKDRILHLCARSWGK